MSVTNASRKAYLKARLYEEERLLLSVQELLAEAAANSGMSDIKIARRLYLTAVWVRLTRESDMAITEAAAQVHACGYRLRVTLEKLP